VLAAVRNALLVESTNVARYRYFQQTAEIEGDSVAAGLFAELAESSACAAGGHIDLLLDYGDPITGQPAGVTHLNLAAALTGELAELGDTYPGLVESALDEGVYDLASWLTTVRALKESHVEKLRAALAAGTGDVVDTPAARTETSHVSS